MHRLNISNEGINLIEYHYFSLRWMKAKLTIPCIQCPSKKSVCTISSNTSSSAGSSLYPLVNVTYNIAEISKALKQSTDITHMAVNAWQGQLHRPFTAVITKVVSPDNVDYHS